MESTTTGRMIRMAKPPTKGLIHLLLLLAALSSVAQSGKCWPGSIGVLSWAKGDRIAFVPFLITGLISWLCSCSSSINIDNKRSDCYGIECAVCFAINKTAACSHEWMDGSWRLFIVGYAMMNMKTMRCFVLARYPCLDVWVYYIHQHYCKLIVSRLGWVRYKSISEVEEVYLKFKCKPVLGIPAVMEDFKMCSTNKRQRDLHKVKIG